MKTELCKQCNAQLTSADWEAGRCTQCGSEALLQPLDDFSSVNWNGTDVEVMQFRDGEGLLTIYLTPTAWKRLKEYGTIIEGVLEAQC